MQLTGFTYHLRKLLHCGEKIIMTHRACRFRGGTARTLCMSFVAQLEHCAIMPKTTQTFDAKYFMRLVGGWHRFQWHNPKLYTPPKKRSYFSFFYDVHTLLYRCTTSILLGYDERKKYTLLRGVYQNSGNSYDI